MFIFFRSIFAVFISLFALSASAHIHLSSVDGVDCSSSKCIKDMVHLQSTSTIEVVYDVEIIHDTNVMLVFIQDGVETVLAENLPEPKGLTSVTVQLPDVECDSCSLRIQASAYSGTANVILSKNGWVSEPDPMMDGSSKAGAVSGWFTFFGLFCVLFQIRKIALKRNKK